MKPPAGPKYQSDGNDRHLKSQALSPFQDPCFDAWRGQEKIAEAARKSTPPWTCSQFGSGWTRIPVQHAVEAVDLFHFPHQVLSLKGCCNSDDGNDEDNDIDINNDSQTHQIHASRKRMSMTENNNIRLAWLPPLIPFTARRRIHWAAAS